MMILPEDLGIGIMAIATELLAVMEELSEGSCQSNLREKSEIVGVLDGDQISTL